MAKISLICEQCGGNIILDDSHEIGTCEHCFAQFVVKQDHIVKNIMQNITKYVYGYEGKDVEELLNDGYQLKQLCDDRKANAKFMYLNPRLPDLHSLLLFHEASHRAFSDSPPSHPHPLPRRS